jgi:hypothetical protein
MKNHESRNFVFSGSPWTRMICRKKTRLNQGPKAHHTGEALRPFYTSINAASLALCGGYQESGPRRSQCVGVS